MAIVKHNRFWDAYGIQQGYGRTGIVTRLGATGGWYVLWAGRSEPVYSPWGIERVRDQPASAHQTSSAEKGPA